MRIKAKTVRIDDIQDLLVNQMGPFTNDDPITAFTLNEGDSEWRYFMPFFTGYHRTAISEAYLPRYAAIWGLVKPKRYLVTGVLLGTSESYSMRKTGHQPEVIVACDYDLDSYNTDRDNMSYAYRNITHPSSGGFGGHLVLVRADSKTCDLQARLGPYDLIMIDGEHGYGAVMKDLDTARSCVAPGGIIMVHDTELGGWNNAFEIKQAFNDWLAKNPHPNILIDDQHFQLGLGLIQC